MSLPAAREIKRIFPSARITYWVRSSLAPLVRASGAAEEVITFDSDLGGPVKRAFRMSRRLADARPQMAVLLQNAFESAFTAWLARVPERAGYPTDLRGPLLTVRVPMAQDIRSRHEVFYYLGITEYLEKHFHGRATALDEPDCSIVLPRALPAGAADLLTGMGVDIGRPIFSLCPGSVNSEAKRWPARRFAQLADLIITELHGEVVFLGSPQEKDLVSGIISMMRESRGVDLTGKTDMTESMAVMSLSEQVVSNDTGSAHLAVAANAAVLTIFGPTTAGATAPYGSKAHIIEGEAHCAPCRHFTCPLPDHPCMNSITAEAVLERIRLIHK